MIKITNTASVGLFRKEIIIEKEKIEESFAFLHNTMQVYLAAYYYSHLALDEERKPENVRGKKISFDKCREGKYHVTKDQAN
jgi:hypothetical protein